MQAQAQSQFQTFAPKVPDVLASLSNPFLSKVLVIPKPGNARSGLMGTSKEMADGLETTNNSPLSSWDFYQRPQTAPSYNIPSKAVGSNVLDATWQLRTRTIDSRPPIFMSNEFEDDLKIESETPFHRRLRLRKMKLRNLKPLYHVLVRLFLNQPISPQDLVLEPPHLHILVEILIRKNKSLAIVR